MKSNKKGFTLTEVVVASAVMAITAGAIFTSLTWARFVVFQNRCHQEAEQVAFDTIWSTFNMRWEELRTFSVRTAPLVVNVHSNTLLYKYNATVATAVLDHGNYFTIKVQVDWDNFGGRFGRFTPQEKLEIIRYNSVRGL